jgi:hypothetical protein
VYAHYYTSTYQQLPRGFSIKRLLGVDLKGRVALGLVGIGILQVDFFLVLCVCVCVCVYVSEWLWV